MAALSRTELGRVLRSFAAGFICLSCTTTLDPTTLGSSPANPDPSEPDPNDPPAPSGCVKEEGMGGEPLSSCVELPPCTRVGDDESHLLCEHALTYEAASYECRLRGGYLVEVNSEAENLLVAGAARQTVGTNVWLGGKRSEAFVWAWEDSQIVFWRGEEGGTPEDGVFVTWQPGEPNNSSTVSDESEKCLALTLGEVDWNDRACSLELPFACEMD